MASVARYDADGSLRQRPFILMSRRRRGSTVAQGVPPADRIVWFESDGSATIHVPPRSIFTALVQFVFRMCATSAILVTYYRHGIIWAAVVALLPLFEDPTGVIVVIRKFFVPGGRPIYLTTNLLLYGIQLGVYMAALLVLRRVELLPSTLMAAMIPAPEDTPA